MTKKSCSIWQGCSSSWYCYSKFSAAALDQPLAAAKGAAAAPAATPAAAFAAAEEAFAAAAAGAWKANITPLFDRGGLFGLCNTFLKL